MSVLSVRVDERDWSALSYGERLRQLEVEGYLVVPDLLTAEDIARLKAETRTLPTTAVDYSVHQQVFGNPQFRGQAMAELAAHPAMLELLGQIFGGELLLMSY